MLVTILTDRHKHEESISELRNSWLESILLYLGLDIHELKDVGSSVFTDYLISNNIDIVNYPSTGSLSISFEGELVGEWAGPDFRLLEDSGGLYYEIDLEYWSIIEEDLDLS